MLKYHNQPQTELDFHLFQEFDNPLLLQPVGLGVRYSAISSQFRQGNVNDTDGVHDFAIDGKGLIEID